MTTTSQNPETLTLFPEAPSENRLRVLVVGRAGLDLLPAVLRGLANLGLTPLSARLHRHDDGTASLPLEFEPQGPAGAERIARALSALPEVRRVAYEEAGGGGLFGRTASSEIPIRAA